MMNRHILLGALLLLQASVSFGQKPTASLASDSMSDPFMPNIKPSLVVRPANGTIELDGDLGDSGWATASRAVNFSENFPGEMTEPPIGIEAWITYDGSNLYVAFLIEDDPDAIRVSMTDRDQIWNDDYVGLLLDTYGDRAWSYFIASNPMGIQGDTRIMPQNEDVGFDVVFHSEGKITDNGYQVEMAIPFRSLRFPGQSEQVWNLNFWITHPRDSRRQYSWAGINQSDPCWMCQWGEVSGIKDITSGGALELLPTVVGSQSGALVDSDDPALGFDEGRLSAEPSLGLKYSLSTNVTADLALNPDFSQVEADAAQVDVNTTFALFFSERRPFFQEGSDLYNTFLNTVYTRSINNPHAAAKLTGRFNRTSVGYIGASDANTPFIIPFEEQSEIVTAGRSFTNIIRGKQTFSEDSYIGALITDRRLYDGGSGSTVGIDGSYRVARNYAIEIQGVFSHTEEPNAPELTEDLDDDLTFDDGKHTAAFDGESFTGHAAAIGLERDARMWNFEIDYETTSPTFRADNGFIMRNNTSRLMTWQGLIFRPNSRVFDRIMPMVIAGYEWNSHRVRKDVYSWLGLNMQLKAQTQFDVRMLLFSHELFREIDHRNIRRIMVRVNSNFSDPVRLGFWVQHGRMIARGEDPPVLGTGTNLEAWGRIKPVSRIVIEPEFAFAKLDHPDTGDSIFNGYILRTRLNYQFTRRLFLRLVTQYNEFDARFEVDPLLTYRINPFTAFYVGSTHDYLQYDSPHGYTRTSRQFFFKFQYLFRV